jgi:hypothetical protein
MESTVASADYAESRVGGFPQIEKRIRRECHGAQ